MIKRVRHECNKEQMRVSMVVGREQRGKLYKGPIRERELEKLVKGGKCEKHRDKK